jgi:hypothetical protein
MSQTPVKRQQRVQDELSRSMLLEPYGPRDGSTLVLNACANAVRSRPRGRTQVWLNGCRQFTLESIVRSSHGVKIRASVPTV